ncbi:MAG: hypothetical protein V4739_07210 [Pseudomonadota bacterium]
MGPLHSSRSVLLGLVALLGVGSAQACSVMRRPLSDYLQQKVPQAVVFRGTVVSVKDKPSQDGVRQPDIRFRVSHWYTGARPKTVTVQGSVGSMAGTSCEGTFDFLPKPGEEWVVIGHRERGHIVPAPLSSVKVVDGTVPPEVAEALPRPRKR